MVYCQRCPHGVVSLLSVCNVRVGLYCAQTAESERIEMLFGRKTRRASRHIVLGVGVGIPHGKGIGR